MARRTVYWSKMRYLCKEEAMTPTGQVLASQPSQMLGVDLMDLRGQTALVAIDFCSGYIKYDPIEGESTDHVMEELNNNFGKLGLVEEIYSDNGPCFKSAKFTHFCRHIEISHQTSSPHYHRSIGCVERPIQTQNRL